MDEVRRKKEEVRSVFGDLEQTLACGQINIEKNNLRSYG